jgi:hypothetical protein
VSLSIPTAVLPSWKETHSQQCRKVPQKSSRRRRASRLRRVCGGRARRGVGSGACAERVRSVCGAERSKGRWAEGSEQRDRGDAVASGGFGIEWTKGWGAKRVRSGAVGRGK